MSVCEIVEQPPAAEGLPTLPVDPYLTRQDRLLLQCLLEEAGTETGDGQRPSNDESKGKEADLIKLLEGMNNVKSEHFEPTVFVSWDLNSFPKGTTFRSLLDIYIEWASNIARYPTDVVFVTHLILYFTTIVPSATYLFYNFTWLHAVLHTLMTGWYFGTYTLMRHNHIHGNGVLSKQHKFFDTTFPYILDPLMGHTWNSYYYHHVKHHHVEGNGPDDLSSTVRLQRDEWSSLAYYVGRFTLLVWFELPYYFLRTGKYKNATRSAFWEFASYAFLISAARSNMRAAVFVFIIPFTIVRLGLMIGNFGQHAFVDELEPDSDYRSSITLIDVPVSFCPPFTSLFCHYIDSTPTPFLSFVPRASSCLPLSTYVHHHQA